MISRPPWVTYITATNASVFDIHEHIVRALELRNRSVLEFDLMNAFKDEREVLRHSIFVRHALILGRNTQ